MVRLIGYGRFDYPGLGGRVGVLGQRCVCVRGDVLVVWVVVLGCWVSVVYVLVVMSWAAARSVMSVEVVHVLVVWVVVARVSGVGVTA